MLFTTPKRRSRRQLSPCGRRLISRRLRAKREFHVKIWTASAALAAASGPVIGGLLVQLSWRWIFLVNIPVGLMAIAVAVRFVPDVKRQLGARIPDLLGGVLLITAIGSLALGLVRAPQWGWTGTPTLVSFALSATALPVFVWRSARHNSPVLDLNLLRSRMLSSASVSAFLYFASFGILLLSSVLWIQSHWHYSAIKTGLSIAEPRMSEAFLSYQLSRRCGNKSRMDNSGHATRPVEKRRRAGVNENASRREAILEAGVEIFGRTPYDLISIDDIAEHAGVAHGLLFHYFRSKRGLYLAVLRRIADDLRAAHDFPDRTGSPAHRMRAAINRHIDYIERHPQTLLAYLRGPARHKSGSVA